LPFFWPTIIFKAAETTLLKRTQCPNRWPFYPNFSAMHIGTRYGVSKL